MSRLKGRVCFHFQHYLSRMLASLNRFTYLKKPLHQQFKGCVLQFIKHKGRFFNVALKTV